MPKISVIIPCFNQGLCLDEAVDSVLAQTFQDFEILVVDDGSTDPETVRMLKDYARPKTRVIHTDNQGLSMARNNGIREAQGAYILPLDADDKIGNGYLADAVRILDRYPDIGIVYCEASYFGIKGGRWDLPEYSLDKILNHNVIFCTALFRRADWEAVGGYNVNMVYGWEDWDFWLSLIQRGRKVYRVPKIHFYYRLREASMVHTMDEERQFFMRLHACLNHRDLYRNIADIEIRCKVAELYLDTGMGFGPSQVLRQIIFTDQSAIEFDLRGFGGIKQFRFDPINAPATIHLNAIQLISEDGTAHEVRDFQDNALYKTGNNLSFETADPQIRFSPAGGGRLVKLVVGLNFLSVGQEVFQDILNHKNGLLKEKNDLLKEKDDRIAEIFRSWSWRITRPLRMLSKLFRG
ncbi:MAG: glycosyltransferase [Syntrophales bacterium]